MSTRNRISAGLLASVLFASLAIADGIVNTGGSGGGTPGGSSGQVQTNNGSGGFGGLTNAQLTALINPATALLSGALPAWPNNTTTFLRGDGTYAVPPGTVAISGTPTTNQLSVWTNGTTVKGITPAVLQSTTLNPAGTTSTIGVHAGMGGTCALTPTYSSRVTASFGGYILNNTAGDGAEVQIRYGTGTAPVNGAALTGTAIGPFSETLGLGANILVPFTTKAIITGLTAGTAYWFDLAEFAVTGGTMTANGIQCSLAEM